VSGTITTRFSYQEIAARAVAAAFQPLQAVVAAPSAFFFVFLTAALFRPPGVRFFPWDRVAFALLMLSLALRALASRREKLPVYGFITWPLLGLLLLALAGILTQPYDAQAWSLFAAKWFVPFVLFQVAGVLIKEPRFLQRFELFTLLVLAYLILTAIASLVGARSLIFPAYILDESLGMHADRARGPFLQAVANGVTLNLLGLMALNAFRRKRIRGGIALLLLSGLPLAILATKTRSVWLAFAGSVVLLLLRSPNIRVRRACAGLVLAGAMALVACVSVTDSSRSLSDRLADRSPVEFRMAVYQAGWEMFQSKPFLGWGGNAMQVELGRRISDFHQDAFYFHNTYLEILVERGLLGLGLYVLLAIGLFRVGSRRKVPEEIAGDGFLDQQFRSGWPVFVLVFLVNGSFVVMNYQFVNGLLFALAGMLAAQNRQLEATSNVG
jgi:putative inorganic carbon (HCO3(-)) transporter